MPNTKPFHGTMHDMVQIEHTSQYLALCPSQENLQLCIVCTVKYQISHLCFRTSHCFSILLSNNSQHRNDCHHHPCYQSQQYPSYTYTNCCTNCYVCSLVCIIYSRLNSIYQPSHHTPSLLHYYIASLSEKAIPELEVGVPVEDPHFDSE